MSLIACGTMAMMARKDKLFCHCDCHGLSRVVLPAGLRQEQTGLSAFMPTYQGHWSDTCKVHGGGEDQERIFFCTPTGLYFYYKCSNSCQG